MDFKITVGPESEPVSLTEAKNHLRVEDYGSPPEHPDDDLITEMIVAAREYVETHLNRAVMPQTVVASADLFRDNMKLPFGGVSAITSIEYLDGDGANQTVTSTVYGLDDYAKPAVVYRKDGQEWPYALAQRNSVRITYEAGYAGSPPDVPKRIKQAMLLLIGDMYENREAKIIGVSSTVNETVEMLLYPLRELGL